MTRIHPVAVAAKPATLIVIGILLLPALQAVAEPQTAGRASTESTGALHPSHPIHQTKQAARTAEIVVKFKDDSKIKDIIEAFWKSPQAAKDKFDLFRRDRSDMAAATLSRVTYSNELVLEFPCNAASAAACLAKAREIAARLAASSDISYAEPDMTIVTEGP